MNMRGESTSCQMSSFDGEYNIAYAQEDMMDVRNMTIFVDIVTCDFAVERPRVCSRTNETI